MEYQIEPGVPFTCGAISRTITSLCNVSLEAVASGEQRFKAGTKAQPSLPVLRWNYSPRHTSEGNRFSPKAW